MNQSRDDYCHQTEGTVTVAVVCGCAVRSAQVVCVCVRVQPAEFMKKANTPHHNSFLSESLFVKAQLAPLQRGKMVVVAYTLAERSRMRVRATWCALEREKDRTATNESR